MKILASGATGLVGQALVPRLLAAGHDVRALSRGGSHREGIGWDVQTGALDRTALERWGSPEALLGEMGEALLLSSQRVLPERLEAAGFRFNHPELSGALQQVLYKI